MNAGASGIERIRSAAGLATGPSLFHEPRPARKPIFTAAVVALARSAALGAFAFALAGCPGTDEQLGPPPVGTAEPGPTLDAGADSDAVASPTDAAAEPLPPKPLRLADYNTHDFFDDLKDGTEQVDSTAEYQAHLASVGAVVGALDPDIVVLQEVEKLGVLDALAEGPLASSGYATRVLVPGNDPRGINIGVLSRYPFDDVVSHKDDSFLEDGTTSPYYRYARDCLELHLTFNGRHVALLGVHFKAKTPPDDPPKRLAEAQHTRSIANTIAATDPTTAIVVLGDYNDTPDSPAVAAVAGLSPDAYTDAPSVMTPQQDAWSYLYQGQEQLIDHQMANPLLSAMREATSVTIPHDADTDAASDHAPIAATYLVH